MEKFDRTSTPSAYFFSYFLRFRFIHITQWCTANTLLVVDAVKSEVINIKEEKCEKIVQLHNLDMLTMKYR